MVELLQQVITLSRKWSDNELPPKQIENLGNTVIRTGSRSMDSVGAGWGVVSCLKQSVVEVFHLISAAVPS